jgi:glutamate synthase domain-containing protein 1
MMPLSASSSHDGRISSKQGRKSDAKIKGRNTNSNRDDLDLDTLWSIVQEKVKKDELDNMNVKSLCR